MNLALTEITWPQLKGLYELYTLGRTKARLLSNAYIRRLKNSRRLLKFKSGNDQILEKALGYDVFFEATFLATYQRYKGFLERIEIVHDGKRPYTFYDLDTLIYIDANKDIFLQALSTERAFSAQAFKGSKYLEENISVSKAVLQLFGLEKFPVEGPKVQQWRLVIDCLEPDFVILCENLDALKRPETARSLHAELWYVGGNNIRILDFLAETQLRLPIYYMCDWDLAGLQIFERVNRALKTKNKSIQLLEPYDPSYSLPVTSPYHNSMWKPELIFSGLNKEIYSDTAILLINKLIYKGEWIEEESQEISQLLRFNGVTT